MSKNFSLLLALRYLNPIRTHVSVITLISLAGVSIGVMVLIVVLSVMDGFEDMVKSRVLGRSPHIVSDRVINWETDNPEQEWRDHVAEIKKTDKVVNAYPLVEDFVLLDYGGNIMNARMQGIDSLNEETMLKFAKSVKEGNGDPNMGAGYEATISSILAKTYGIQVGDKIELISNRNLKLLKPLIDQKDFTPLSEQKKEQLRGIQLSMQLKMKPFQGKLAMLNPEVQTLKTRLVEWQGLEIRTAEKKLLQEVINLLGSDDYEDDPNGNNFYPTDRLEEIIAKIEEIKTLNVYKSDSDSISEVALPKDVVIAAIYTTDPYAPGPDLYVPISVAQELAGAGDSSQVSRIAITLEDAYKAQKVLDGDLKDIVSGSWQGSTWMEQHKEQFSLISSQKSMMTIALSFIILIAVFSIGAVMFTITYQKKKEIGVMIALGATPGQITLVFTLQGLIVGIFGALIGWGLSLLVLFNLDTIQDTIAAWGFNPFSKSFFGVDSLPYIINTWEVTCVCFGAFVLCTLAALGPAWLASRTDAAKSLRNM